MQFIDIATIEVVAGDGGNGCIAFRREKFVAHGGPSGGDGGNGGSVILIGDHRLNTLQDLQYRRHYKADRGQHGKGSTWHGKSAENITIRVPCGTLVFDDGTGQLIADVVHEGQEVIVARGGHGGRGNAQFATATRQAPDFAEDGRAGEQRTLRLELKLLADVGLVGLPNAGKSTLLAAMSSARPKIADYPFTTLVPNLGVVRLGGFTTCVMADIPGLIEGAHLGKGLGDQFLRHIERTRILVFLVDSASETPKEDLKVLRDELRQFDRTLVDRPWIYVLTKADLWPADEIPKVRKPRGASAAVVVSAVTGYGIDKLRRAIADLVVEAPDAGVDDDPLIDYTQKLPTDNPDREAGTRDDG